MQNIGWSEHDIISKAWQVYTWSGKVWVKMNFNGNFASVDKEGHGQNKVSFLSDVEQLFPQIRNVADSEGVIIAKRKKPSDPLIPCRGKKKALKKVM